MKQLLITFAIFGAWAPQQYVQAQNKSEQTIVIDDSSPETTVEIKDGQVFVDGKKVAPYNLKHNLKIIRKFGNAKTYEFHVEGDTPQEDMDFSLRRNDGDRGVITTNRPMLGVQSEPTPNHAGAQVQIVSDASPAELAGIQAGDIITKIDNQVITSPQDLAEVITSYKPNDKVDITLQRNGEEKTIAVILSEQQSYSNAPQSFEFPGMDEMFREFQDMSRQWQNGFSFSWPPNNGNGQMFSRVTPGTPRVAEGPKIGAQVEERADSDGLLVTEVKQGSTAEKAGLKTGDVITTIGGKKMTNVDDLTNTLYELKSKRDIVVTVKRGSKTETLYVEMPVELRKRDF
ncbi:MAG: hypothetical protein RL660_268 [Bacteroidota bacterium]|jgi:serine protease Do